MPDCHVFDRDRGYHSFIADAYEGGAAWEHPSSPTMGVSRLYSRRVQPAPAGESGDVVVEKIEATVNSYLSPWPAETLSSYERRRRLAVYVNLVQPVVDAYVDTVTERVTRDLGGLAPYLGNLDRQGQTWPEFVGDVARQAALDGVTAVVLDNPPSNTATNRAEEVAQGVGLRATVVPVASWAWLEYDADGALCEFAYADAMNADPTATQHTVRVWVWTLAGWSVHECSLPTGDAVEKHRGAILATAPQRSGPLPAGLTRIPVEFAFHRRVRRTRAPRGTSIAAAPAAISLQVYQLLSAIEDTHRRAPPFLAVPTRASNGLEPETKAKVGPDAALETPEGSTPQWVTFPPESLKDIREHVVYLVALAFRVSGLEVQADASAQVQSGEALRVRSRDFEARAKKLANDLRAFEVRALALAASMLGMRDAPSVTYPQRFVLGDPSELLAAAVLLVQQVGDRLGAEGTTEAVRQAVNAALALDDATAAKVMAEVTDKLKNGAPPQKELFAYDYDAGVVSVDEVRATKGLPPLASGAGKVSVLEWAKGIEARALKGEAPAPMRAEAA